MRCAISVGQEIDSVNYKLLKDSYSRLYLVLQLLVGVILLREGFGQGTDQASGGNM